MRVRIALCLFATTLIFAGCGKQPSTTAPAKSIEVAVVVPGMTSPFHAQIKNGAVEAGEKLGWKVNVMAPQRETDFKKQVEIVDDMITRGAKAISVNSIDDKAIVKACKDANEKGIPFFIHNSLTKIPAGKVTAYIGYDQRAGGRKMGEYAIKLLRGTGKVAILQGIPGFHTTERVGGFKDALKTAAGIKIAGEQPANWERERAMYVASNMLQANPDIKLFYAVSDEMALGAAAACKQAGKKGILILGIDGNPNAVDAVQKGEITATLGTNPRKMGAKIIESMQAALSGNTVPEMVETQTVVVDKGNAEQYSKE